MTGSAPLPVIVNSGGGGAAQAGDALAAKLRAAFASTGREIALELVSGDELSAALARHAGAPRIVAGGGDGTVRSAAQALMPSGGELAIVPLGTRNHFARQLGIPLDLAEAAAVAVEGIVTQVDVGEAGDCLFLNNASLGAYAELVRKRDASGLPKWLGSLVAGADVVRRLRPRHYDLVLDGARRRVETVELFIGNGRYEVAEGKPGKRQSLTEGRLSTLAAAPLTRLGLLRAAYRLARGTADLAEDFALDADASELRIEGAGTVGVALDGENLTLALPLVLRSLPRALKVVVPR